ncbi:MAG: hypothetical protein JWQ03_1457 [Variovorax sp.]|nr:hypothetical protein [Variovorax sp.]
MPVEPEPAPAPSGMPPCRAVKFSAVLLVCGACEKRGSGPSRLRAKDVRHALKKPLGAARHTLRVVQTSCLGLCPKKAMALVAVGAGTPPVAAEVKSEAEAAAFAATLATAPRRAA